MTTSRNLSASCSHNAANLSNIDSLIVEESHAMEREGHQQKIELPILQHWSLPTKSITFDSS